MKHGHTGLVILLGIVLVLFDIKNIQTGLLHVSTVYAGENAGSNKGFTPGTIVTIPLQFRGRRQADQSSQAPATSGFGSAASRMKKSKTTLQGVSVGTAPGQAPSNSQAQATLGIVTNPANVKLAGAGNTPRVGQRITLQNISIRNTGKAPSLAGQFSLRVSCQGPAGGLSGSCPPELIVPLIPAGQTRRVNINAAIIPRKSGKYRFSLTLMSRALKAGGNLSAGRLWRKEIYVAPKPAALSTSPSTPERVSPAAGSRPASPTVSPARTASPSGGESSPERARPAGGGARATDTGASGGSRTAEPEESPAVRIQPRDTGRRTAE